MTQLSTLSSPPAANHGREAGSDSVRTHFSLWPQTTVGTKFVIAITGLGLSIFVLFHMIGNLQVLMGRHVINGYAQFLKNNPELLWLARIGLLLIFIVHIVLAVQLRLRSRAARPQRYVYQQQLREATLASRSMLLSGIVLLLFVVYHLAHFTLGFTHPAHFRLHEVHVNGDWIHASEYEGNVEELPERLKRHDVYSMAIWGFRDPLVTIPYLLAMGFLGLHLSHGILSSFQTLGVNHPRWRKVICTISLGWAWIVVAGNVAIPILIMLGAIPDLPQPLPGH